MIKRAIYFFAALFISLVLLHACANMGMPRGGPKDKTPPVILKSVPAQNEVNFQDNKVRITFNEFVIQESLSEKFISSPPTTKKPLFRTKGKTFIVDLNEKLLPNTTYSLDFKDGIVDNNENNKLRNLRLAFSTGPVLDTLRIVGFVRDAFTLEPSRNCYVLLYKGESDTLVYKKRPDFVAKTDEQGFFAVTNLPATSYQLYAMSDIDNNLKYTSSVDSIAFLGKRITPTAEFQPKRDTVVTGSDTLVVLGKTRFYPDPVNFSLFFEKGFDLSLDKYERTRRNMVDLTFIGSTADTFNIELLNIKPQGKWNLIEKSRNADTLKVWITDSLVYERDTLALKLTYLQKDSLGVFFNKQDTVKLYFQDRENQKQEKAKRSQRRKIVTEAKDVTLASNVMGNFDTYRDIIIESPEPVSSFDTSLVKLFEKKDTIYFNVSCKVSPDTAHLRRFHIAHPWKFGTSYRLMIDSTALQTVYGLYGKEFKIDFKTQEEEHYGKILVSVKNIKGPTIIQLLDYVKEETVLKQVKIDKDQVITFPFLEPKKFLLKAIFDRNNNGIWDPGNLKEKLEPEEVCYYQTVIKIRSNFENYPSWELPDPLIFRKKIVDEEAEAEKLKKKKSPPKRSGMF